MLIVVHSWRQNNIQDHGTESPTQEDIDSITKKIMERNNKFYLIILILFSIFNCEKLFCQIPDTLILKRPVLDGRIYKCIWGDKLLMELHSNKRIYKFKSGLKDGLYFAFFDSSLKVDTAMIATIKNGELNGLLIRWDRSDHYITEECQYLNGEINGYRKLYYITPDERKLANIQYWIDGAHDKDIQIEW